MPKTIKALIISFLLIVPAFGAINLPDAKITNEPRFLLSHRFFGMVGKSDFLGMDAGANVGLGFGINLKPNLDLAFQRFSLNQEYQLSGKYLLFDGAAVVIGADYRSTAAITMNRTSLFSQLVISRGFYNDQLVVSIIPALASAADLNNSSATENDSAALGLAFDFTKKVDSGYLQEFGLSGEYNYTFSGYRLSNPTVSFGVKVETWGHTFTLLLANYFVNSVSGYLPGTDLNSLYFGFNLERRFSL